MGVEDKVKVIKSYHPELVFDNPIKVLGSGSFGWCVRGYSCGTPRKEYVAIKISKDNDPQLGDVAAILNNESQVMKGLSHKHVIGFVDSGAAKDVYSLETFRWMVLSLATEGSLRDWLDRGCTPFSRLKVMYQIFGGLKYIHSESVYHRDVKPENVLVHKEADGSWVLKLADFGLAETERWSCNSSGTIVYLPPEIMIQQMPYDNAGIDVYSSALILVEMFSPGLQLPWKDDYGHATWLAARGTERLCQHNHNLLAFFNKSLVPARQRENASELQARLQRLLDAHGISN